MVSSFFLNTLNLISTISAVAIFSSLIPDLYGVYKTKRTDSVNFYPLLAMLAQSALWTLYGCLTGLVYPLAVVNGYGAVMGLAYLVVYCIFETTRRRQYLAYIGIVMSAFVALMLYAAYSPEEKDTINGRIGYLSNAAAITFFASPLGALQRVIREGCSDILSIGMAFTGCINGTLWGLIGYVQNDTFVMVPNSISAGLCAIQIMFIAYFPRSNNINVKSLDEDTSLMHAHHSYSAGGGPIDIRNLEYANDHQVASKA